MAAGLLPGDGGFFPSAGGALLKGAKYSLCTVSNHKILLLPFLSFCFLNTLDKNSGRQHCSWKDATLQKWKVSCQYYSATCVRKWNKRGLCLYSLLIVSKSLLLLLLLNHFSCVWLFATLWTVTHQAPLSMGILQAKILEWVAVPSSMGSSRPRDQTCISYVSCTGRWALYHWHHLGRPTITQPLEIWCLALCCTEIIVSNF